MIAEESDWDDMMVLDMVPMKEEMPLEDRKRNKLCMKLLDTINHSVTTFRPSESLACLKAIKSTETVHRPPPVEIDVVVSGGGLKGYFMAGCGHVLLHELEIQNVKIARVAGASAGAWVGMFLLTNFGTENWIESYYKCQERPEMTMHEAYEDFWPWANSCMPENAWQICSGRLFISITEVSWRGFTNHMISEFTSNRDLFEACLASSTVPFLSTPKILRHYRGMWVLDGGLTNNTPCFPDHVRRQLVFRLTDVFYPGRLLLDPSDRCIEALVVRGAILMSRFLQGEPSDSFAWLDVNENKASIMRKSVWRWRFFYTIMGGVLGWSGYKLLTDRAWNTAARQHLSSLSKLTAGWMPSWMTWTSWRWGSK